MSYFLKRISISLKQKKLIESFFELESVKKSKENNRSIN